MAKQLYDVIIIGGGQAGLAAAYYAQKHSLSYLILESGPAPGQSWQDRYDSLTLFTPRKYSSLPGLALPGDPNDYPTKNDMAEYLQRYAKQYNLHLTTNQKVTSLTKSKELFTLVTSIKKYHSRTVIVATGPFQASRVPKWSHKVSIPHLPSAEYRNPRQISPGKVLVVGGGNSGAQIAEELSATHLVTVATKQKPVVIPSHFFGKSLFWWLEKLQLLHAPDASWPARHILKRPEPIIGTNLPSLIKSGRIRLTSTAVDSYDKTIHFADGSQESFDCVIWCTGFTTDYSWINIDAAISDNYPIQKHGQASHVPGLYFIGLTWLRARSSALVGGVGLDAEHIINSIIKRQP